MTNEFSSEDYVKQLVDSVTDNCRNVEELAMVEINARHIPLINSTLCLTNADCKIILNKCQHHCHNVLETSALLIALTDFVSCVAANSETFPMGSEKKKTRKITVLMQALHNNWSKLFAKLSNENMSLGQIFGIANIVKRCLERIPPQSTYKMYMEKIMKMADKALFTLFNPPETKDIHIKAEQHSSREITLSKSSSFTKSSEAIFQPSNRHGEQKKENKAKVKQSYDITKFILKPCENMMNGESNEKVEKSLSGKRKFQVFELEQAVLDSERIEKSPVVHLDEAPPPAKKHCVHDDFINGKMNAFKMLMKAHKTNGQLRQLNENSLAVNR